jgi:malic enzyme
MKAKDVLEYHRYPRPGKIKIVSSKPLDSVEDLCLAYSPGVSIPCEEIAKCPDDSYLYTNRSSLVAVITNGTAVLGLGNIGPFAAKPVMEGKSGLIHKFAHLDSIDIEIMEENQEKLVEIIASLEPSFGGINLEDIKAPECFYVEEELKKRMKIPVFHDDQHGTAIIVAAALMNALEIIKKNKEDIKIAVSGAGAAALACLKILNTLGFPKKNMWVCDREGLITTSRNNIDKYKMNYAQNSEPKNIHEVVVDSDVFIGLSIANILKAEDISSMKRDPIVFGLANPVPEIMPDVAKSVRSDIIMATGRSDFPNQVNNLLCFPYIFRGALDVLATQINDEMKLACVHEISELGKSMSNYGRDALIPSPFDPRLLENIASAVAESAMKSGVAKKIINIEEYRDYLRNISCPASILINSSEKKDVYLCGDDSEAISSFAEYASESINPIIVNSNNELDTLSKEKIIINFNNLENDIEKENSKNTFGNMIPVITEEKIKFFAYYDEKYSMQENIETIDKIINHIHKLSMPIKIFATNKSLIEDIKKKHEICNPEDCNIFIAPSYDSLKFTTQIISEDFVGCIMSPSNMQNIDSNANHRQILSMIFLIP